MKHRQSFTLIIVLAVVAIMGLIAFGIRKNGMFPLQADSGRESGVDYFFEQNLREDGPPDDDNTAEWRQHRDEDLRQRQEAAAEFFRARIERQPGSAASRARQGSTTSRSTRRMWRL